MTRSFRHATEGRTWSIDVVGREIRISIENDGEPAEPIRRIRREATERAAREAAAALITEQVADGFVELGATRKEESADGFFDRGLAAWSKAAPDVPAADWRRKVSALPSTLRERLHRELLAVRSARDWQPATWLRMQAPLMPAALLLSLRDPSVGSFALWVLDGLVVAPLPLGAFPGLGSLGHGPTERALHLEAALVSLIQAPPPGESPATFRAVDRFEFGPSSVAKIVATIRAADPAHATGAALVSSRYPYLSRREVLEALAAWNTRLEVRSLGAATGVLRAAVMHLGQALLGVAERPRTHAELAALLQTALARSEG